MIEEKILNSLYCAVSVAQHLVDEPIDLACGHFVCKKCKHDLDLFLSKCLHCESVGKVKMVKFADSNGLTKTIESYLDDLFKMCYEKFKKCLTTYTSMIKNFVYEMKLVY